MYWLASASTMSSSSSSRWPEGTMIFLVITIAAGRASATFLCSAAEPLVGPLERVGHEIEVGDVAVGDDVSHQRLDGVALEAVAPLPASASSTSLIAVELISTPISAGYFVLNASRTELSLSASMAALGPALRPMLIDITVTNSSRSGPGHRKRRQSGSSTSQSKGTDVQTGDGRRHGQVGREGGLARAALAASYRRAHAAASSPASRPRGRRDRRRCRSHCTGSPLSAAGHAR